MRNNHGKRLKLLLFLAVNTIVILLLIVYGKQNQFSRIENELIDEKNRIVEIHSVEDYLTFAESVSDANDYAHWKIVFCEDLDFSEYEDLPVIGDAEGEEEAVIFRGKVEGNGHKITGYHLSNPEGRAALFARFGGVIQNLQIEDSSFKGELCGAITAESYEASILNCYVDATVEGEVAGTIAGRLFGDIINCVTSDAAVGEVQYGGTECCFFTGAEDLDALNDNLYFISGIYRDTSFCHWERSETGILSGRKENLLDSLAACLVVGDQELNFDGFYSEADSEWYIALPASYGNAELLIEAKTSHGDYKSLFRKAGQEELSFTLADQKYSVNFLSADNVESMYLILDDEQSLEYVHANKSEEIPGNLLLIDEAGNVESLTIKGFYGHGNDSWEAAKKSYNLKFDSDIDLLNMGANEDFTLLAGYRMNSLMSYVTSTELVQEIGFEYAPEFRLVSLYVNGEYLGIYFLTERIEIDENRIEITNLYDKTKKLNHNHLNDYQYEMSLNEETKEKRYYYNVGRNPEDITGGYLLELDVADYGPEVSRFITKDRKNKVTLKRARYSSEEQVNYIADYWQEFEDALLSETGVNEQGKRYTEYIDLESFAMQWLMYELAQEASMKSSIYYYKESSVDGDGLLHACYPWDVERSYCKTDQLEEFWNVNTQGEYWTAFYQHEDFRKEVAHVWFEKLLPAVELMISEEALVTESGLKNLSWYEEMLTEIDQMENVRWSDSKMIEKCSTIRYILSVRKEVLTSIFAI